MTTKTLEFTKLELDQLHDMLKYVFEVLYNGQNPNHDLTYILAGGNFSKDMLIHLLEKTG